MSATANVFNCERGALSLPNSKTQMIRWRVPELLEARGWTAYRLAQEAGLTMTAAYRLAKPGAIQRIDTATLEALCDVFRCGPGDLLVRTKQLATRPRPRR
jgi:DNA-binding Xre family transcriptional regulator